MRKGRNRDKKRQKKLGYEEWRKRELERMVMSSYLPIDKKLTCLKEIRS
jgi:hypothetical protein